MVIGFSSLSLQGAAVYALELPLLALLRISSCRPPAHVTGEPQRDFGTLRDGSGKSHQILLHSLHPLGPFRSLQYGRTVQFAAPLGLALEIVSL